MAGIKDVAKEAGVGVGTVSRYLNDSGYVSEETRAKIEAAMKKLDYIPNELARNLYHKKTGIIAVLVLVDIAAPTVCTNVTQVQGFVLHGFRTSFDGRAGRQKSALLAATSKVASPRMQKEQPDGVHYRSGCSFCLILGNGGGSSVHFCAYACNAAVCAALFCRHAMTSSLDRISSSLRRKSSGSK